MVFDEKLNNTWWTLRIALGVVPILAGFDKFFNLLTNWEAYLHPAVPQLLHVPAVTFMHVVGVIEIIAGIVVLSNFTRLGAYIVMAWLIGIALSLATQGRYFDIAVRDLLISVAAFSLAKLTEVREAALGLDRHHPSAIPLPRAS
jgi:uncharacterized membrane protein YphA (DoxX/SURF4 family)